MKINRLSARADRVRLLRGFALLGHLGVFICSVAGGRKSLLLLQLCETSLRII